MTREEEKYTTLDTEQCKWWVNHLFNIAKEKACNSHNFDDAEEIQSAQDKIIKALEQEPKFIVKSDGTIEQIKNCNDCLSKKELEKIGKMISDVLEKQTEQEPKITNYYTNEKGQRIQIDYDIYDTARISRDLLEIYLEEHGFRKCGE